MISEAWQVTENDDGFWVHKADDPSELAGPFATRQDADFWVLLESGTDLTAR